MITVLIPNCKPLQNQALLASLCSPKQPDDGLDVADPAVRRHGKRVVERQREDFEELAVVELCLALLQPGGEPQLDTLVRVADSVVDQAKPRPRRGHVARLLEQLALRRRKML